MLMSFVAEHLGSLLFSFLLIIFTSTLCLSKTVLTRLFGFLIYLNTLYFFSQFCGINYQHLNSFSFPSTNNLFPFTTDSIYTIIISLIIIVCIVILIVHSKKPKKYDSDYEFSDNERIQEGSEAFKNLLNDYSSLLKFLITLSSTSIVLSGSFLEKHGITPTIKFSWLCWSSCILLSLFSLGLSIYNQNKYIDQLYDLDLKTKDINQPSNEGEYVCTTLAGITFVIAFIFFTISVWTNTNQPQETTGAKVTAITPQASLCTNPWRSGLPSA